jgi:hypothetical protein
MFSAGSSIAFIAGIERLRKKWSLPSMKRSTAAAVAASLVSAREGPIARMKSEVAARLRLWFVAVLVFVFLIFILVFLILIFVQNADGELILQ